MSLKCPKKECKNDSIFYINAVTDVKVDGKTEYVEGHEGFFWDENSICCCYQCGYEGKVKEFEQGEANG